MEGLEKHLPGQVKKFIADHNINFYTIDGVKIGIETGMGPTRINTILQSAFFELTGIIPAEKANELMKAAAKATSSQNQPKKADAKPKKKRFAFLSAVRSEMRRVTWPTKQDVLQWTGVVVLALLFFGVFVTILDDWVVTPILLAISSLSGLGA